MEFPGASLRPGGWQDAGDDDDGNNKSKEKRRRKKEKERQEQLVKEKEAKLLDAKHAPETAEEFERLVMSSPNSSFIWIKYMAFHLELTEIDKAREVCVETCMFARLLIALPLFAHPFGCQFCLLILASSRRPCRVRVVWTACACTCAWECACMSRTESASLMRRGRGVGRCRRGPSKPSTSARSRRS